jgi:general secretion pathway protein G
VRRKGTSAFTLIELIVVMAIVALLVSIAVPRYFQSIERSKEAVLRQNLATMRDALDQFLGDQGRFPDSIDELVAKRYLRSVPLDPITDSRETWIVVPPPADSGRSGAYDVRSGAAGAAPDGSAYADW